MIINLNRSFSPENLTIRTFETANTIDQKDWKKVYGKKDYLFLSLPYLEILEECLKTQVSFYYIIFYQEEKPIGIAVLKSFRLSAQNLPMERLSCSIIEPLKKNFLGIAKPNILICGNLFSTTHPDFLFLDEIESDTELQLITDTLFDYANKEEKSSFMFLKDLNLPQQAKAHLENEEFTLLSTDPVMELQLQKKWFNLQNYQSSLKTKFRTRMKKAYEASSSVKRRTLELEEIIQLRPQFAVLYENVISRAEFKIAELSVDCFIKFKENFPKEFLVQGYFLNEQLVAFSTGFLIKNTFEAFHIGLDYELNKTYSLYQRMLYDYLDTAITFNCTKLLLGRTAETIKSSIGAVPIAQNVYVKHRNKFSNKLWSSLLETIKPEQFEIRNPFKRIA